MITGLLVLLGALGHTTSFFEDAADPWGVAAPPEGLRRAGGRRGAAPPCLGLLVFALLLPDVWDRRSSWCEEPSLSRG